MTSTPSYDAPKQTAPLLVAAAATPPLTEVPYVTSHPSTLSFSAAVMSEDAGSAVELVLDIDYGNEMNGKPFAGQPQSFDQSMQPGTLDDGPRATPILSVGTQEFVDDYSSLPPGTPHFGCHTVTLLASHARLERGCPRCIADSSSLTWLVITCKEDDNCPTVMIDSNNCTLLKHEWTGGCPIENDDAGTCPFQSLGGSGG